MSDFLEQSLDEVSLDRLVKAIACRSKTMTLTVCATEDISDAQYYTKGSCLQLISQAVTQVCDIADECDISADNVKRAIDVGLSVKGDGNEQKLS